MAWACSIVLCFWFVLPRLVVADAMLQELDSFSRYNESHRILPYHLTKIVHCDDHAAFVESGFCYSLSSIAPTTADGTVMLTKWKVEFVLTPQTMIHREDQVELTELNDFSYCITCQLHDRSDPRRIMLHCLCIPKPEIHPDSMCITQLSIPTDSFLNETLVSSDLSTGCLSNASKYFTERDDLELSEMRSKRLDASFVTNETVLNFLVSASSQCSVTRLQFDARIGVFSNNISIANCTANETHSGKSVWGRVRNQYQHDVSIYSISPASNLIHIASLDLQTNLISSLRHVPVCGTDSIKLLRPIGAPTLITTQQQNQATNPTVALAAVCFFADNRPVTMLTFVDPDTFTDQARHLISYDSKWMDFAFSPYMQTLVFLDYFLSSFLVVFIDTVHLVSTKELVMTFVPGSSNVIAQLPLLSLDSPQQHEWFHLSPRTMLYGPMMIVVEQNRLAVGYVQIDIGVSLGQIDVRAQNLLLDFFVVVFCSLLLYLLVIMCIHNRQCYENWNKCVRKRGRVADG